MVVIVREPIKPEFEFGFGYWRGGVDYDVFDNRRSGYKRGRVDYNSSIIEDSTIELSIELSIEESTLISIL